MWQIVKWGEKYHYAKWHTFGVVSCLICYFFRHIVLYWDKVTSWQKFSSNFTLEVEIVWKISNLTVLREYNVFNIEWVEVHKMSEVFRANLYCKMCDPFASFCWLWDFLVENMPEIAFSKKYFQVGDFESFIFWSKFRFLGDCFRRFS